MTSALINFLLDKKSKGLPMNIGQAMSELDLWREGKVESEANTFRIEWEKNNK
tara:strand:+ start:3925 stop:4083 length:159 start_codon:yes stop_codon:yes gene_type:complete